MLYNTTTFFLKIGEGKYEDNFWVTVKKYSNFVTI